MKICRITCPGAEGERKDRNSMLSVNRLANNWRVIPLLETAYCNNTDTVMTSFILYEAEYVRDKKYPLQKSCLSQHLTATVSNSISHQAQGKPRSSQIHTHLMDKEQLWRDFLSLIPAIQHSFNHTTIKINRTVEFSFEQS
jgi:hypothetical protein